MENQLVRTATSEDIPRMLELERGCPSAAHWSEQQYRKNIVTLQISYLCLVAEGTLVPDSVRSNGRTVLGFLVAHQVADQWELENIVVADAARCKGIGTRLLQAFLDRAIQTQADSLFLEVRESNTAARKLYEKLNFCETGRRKAYYSNPAEDAILYVKTPL